MASKGLFFDIRDNNSYSRECGDGDSKILNGIRSQTHLKGLRKIILTRLFATSFPKDVGMGLVQKS